MIASPIAAQGEAHGPGWSCDWIPLPPANSYVFGWKVPERLQDSWPGRFMALAIQGLGQNHGLPGCHFIQGQMTVVDLKRQKVHRCDVESATVLRPFVGDRLLGMPASCQGA